MQYVLGIDVGGSTTKIVALDQAGKLCDCLQVEAGDQLTSLYGAIGSILYKMGATLGDVRRLVLTGVGATAAEGDLYGIPTERVAEFEAIGRGGLLLAGLDEALVVSVGTGTAFVRACGKECRHIGGSGVGGGTLLGLSSKLFGTRDIDALAALAEKGELANVDLQVGDICNTEISSLPPYVTASNFGKIKSTATDGDMALGLFNTIFQTVGTLAVFACLDRKSKNIVFTGTLVSQPAAKPLLDEVAKLHGVSFIIPEKATFATALGAAAICFEAE